MANFEISVKNLNELENEYREETFTNYPNIKYLAITGLYVKSNGFLVCHKCNKEVEILKHVEKVKENLFHYKNCAYFRTLSNGNDLVTENSNSGNHKTDLVENELCIIEYMVSEETMNMSLDSKLDQVLRCGYTRDIAHAVLINHWKQFGKDYDSFYELLIDIKHYKPSNPATPQRNSMSNIVLADHLCAVCMVTNKEIIFLPCGHLCACGVCSLNITDCPICRKHIKKKVSNFKFNYEGL